jgi:ubiquitin C-terminal hydrolase
MKYGKKGLLNIGNTCFMNAAIQTLSNMKPLRKYLFSIFNSGIFDKTRSVENPVDKLLEIQRRNLIKHFTNILLQLWSGSDNKFVHGDIIQPFRNRIQNFNLGGQHDCSEIFGQIYEDIHTTLLDPLTKSIPRSDIRSVLILHNGEIIHATTGDENNEIKQSLFEGNEFNQIHHNAITKLKTVRSRSIISELFDIYIRRVTINNVCENIGEDLYKIDYSVEKSLQLDIPHTERNYWICPECQTENVYKHDDLVCTACDTALVEQPQIKMPQYYRMPIGNLLEYYTTKESLASDEYLKSDICEGSYYQFREPRFVSLPPILNFTFRRIITRNGFYMKVDVPVDIPLVLNMSTYVDPLVYIGSDKSLLYDLQSIVWHGGFSRANGGHYKVWSKQDGYWYEFNDSDVKKISLNTEIINGDTYIKDYDKSDYTWNIYMTVYNRQDIDGFTYNHITQLPDEHTISKDGEPKLTEPKLTEPVKSKLSTINDVTEMDDEEQEQEQEQLETDIESKQDIVQDVVEKDIAVEELPKTGLVDIPELQGIQFDTDLFDINKQDEDNEDNENDEDYDTLEKEYDLVEIIINYPDEPVSDLLLENTKWVNEDDGYYLANKQSDEPISLYMLYEKSSDDISDGNKIPIDNTLYYYNSETNENSIYGVLNEYDNKTLERVKDIENKIYENTYTVKRD